MRNLELSKKRKRGREKSENKLKTLILLFLINLRDVYSK